MFYLNNNYKIMHKIQEKKKKSQSSSIVCQASSSVCVCNPPYADKCLSCDRVLSDCLNACVCSVSMDDAFVCVYVASLFLGLSRTPARYVCCCCCCLGARTIGVFG